MMLRVWPGEAVRLDAKFTGSDGAGMAAVGVAITAKAPDGSIVAGTVIAEQETGAFYAVLTATMPGVWAVRASCSGPTPSADESRFEVARSYVL